MPRSSIFWLLLAIAVCSCAPESEVVESIEQLESAATEAGHVRVVQFNPFYSGKYSKPDTDGPITWETATRFAAEFTTTLKGATVVGMQEMKSKADVTRIRKLLEDATGKAWTARYYPQGVGGTGSGSGIFYRTGLYHLVEDFGWKEVGVVDATEPYSIRFGGLLLRIKGTTRRFAFFSGKLAWGGATIHGLPVTSADRLRQARTLKEWIDDKLVAWPNAARIIATDLNDSFGSSVRESMLETYRDGDAYSPTSTSGKRLDYVFYDYDGGPRGKKGYVDPHPGHYCGKAPGYGSDHEFVYADVYVKRPDE